MAADPGDGMSRTFGSRYADLESTDDTWNTLLSGKQGKSTKQKRNALRELSHEQQFMKQMKVDNVNGPRFLVLERTDSGETMKNVSPFLIKKAIDCITPNVTITRTKEGHLLLRTVDKQQAAKLVKQKTLANIINIKITEHGTLNQSRGTIYCPDLKMMTDEEILGGFRENQPHVIEVKRLQRKTKEGQLEDTGVFVLTFDLGSIPASVNAGFYPCKVKQYVPDPMRCTNCLKFGHKKANCRGNRICANCAELFHDNTACQKKLTCVNCRGDHHGLSKKCPIYLDEYEIQRLKVTDKISMKDARQKRRSQAPDPAPPKPTRPFSEVVKNLNLTSNRAQQNNRTLPVSTPLPIGKPNGIPVSPIPQLNRNQQTSPANNENPDDNMQNDEDPSGSPRSWSTLELIDIESNTNDITMNNNANLNTNLNNPNTNETNQNISSEHTNLLTITQAIKDSVEVNNYSDTEL